MSSKNRKNRVSVSKSNNKEPENNSNSIVNEHEDPNHCCPLDCPQYSEETNQQKDNSCYQQFIPDHHSTLIQSSNNEESRPQVPTGFQSLPYDTTSDTEGDSKIDKCQQTEHDQIQQPSSSNRGSMIDRNINNFFIIPTDTDDSSSQTVNISSLQQGDLTLNTTKYNLPLNFYRLNKSVIKYQQVNNDGDDDCNCINMPTKSDQCTNPQCSQPVPFPLNNRRPGTPSPGTASMENEFSSVVGPNNNPSRPGSSVKRPCFNQSSPNYRPTSLYWEHYKYYSLPPKDDRKVGVPIKDTKCTQTNNKKESNSPCHIDLENFIMIQRSKCKPKTPTKVRDSRCICSCPCERTFQRMQSEDGKVLVPDCPDICELVNSNLEQLCANNQKDMNLNYLQNDDEQIATFQRVQANSYVENTSRHYSAGSDKKTGHGNEDFNYFMNDLIKPFKMYNYDLDST